MVTQKKTSKPKKTSKKSYPKGGPKKAVPPPDDPLRRAQEFDPDREQKSREMAEKRLEAIRQTKQMPTASEEAAERKSEETPSQADSDST
jgi:hypothetical protein